MPSPGSAAQPTEEPPSVSRIPGLRGHLWFDRTLGDLWQVDLVSARATQVAVPSGVFALQPTVPVSGTPLAFTGVPEANGIISGTYHIYVDGRRIIADDADASYQDPAWSADGTRLFFTRIGRLPGQTVTHASGLNIQMVDFRAGVLPRTVVTDAVQPALSSDGQWLAYVGVDITQPPNLSKSIRERNLLSGEDRLVLSAGHFDDIFGPRWMPNGSQLIFSALDPVGGPQPQPPGSGSTGGLWGAIDALFGVRVAAAHTWTGDVWRVNADGTGLTRLTHELFSAPIVAPAPDGNHIAVAALNGIWVMNADGSNLARVSDADTNGNLDWSE